MRTARIYIVRHGETDGNRQGIIQGQLDVQLNATGLVQSEAVAKALQSIPFESAYSSDLLRATKVCVIIFHRCCGT
jgi:broad specificity phosphatase PhoE